MELKPCPFCGGVANLVEADLGAKVVCTECGAETGYHIDLFCSGRTLSQNAIEHWNTRAERTCRNLAEPDEVYDRPFICSECGASGPYGEGTYHMAKTEVVGKELADALGIAEGSVIHSDSWPVWKYCPCCGAKVVKG